NGQYVRTELEDSQGTFILSPAPINGFDPDIDGVVALPLPPAATPVSYPALVATAIMPVEPVDNPSWDAPIAIEAARRIEVQGIAAAIQQGAPPVSLVSEADVGVAAAVPSASAISNLASLAAPLTASPLSSAAFQVAGNSRLVAPVAGDQL